MPKTPSLFVGRWQPFHQGHKTLIETVLKKGKPVVIAIRDTEISHKNPYSTAERWTKIQDELKEYGSLVKIIVIPDIDEICYGRDVGYKIRQISLEKEIEEISGTKTRLLNPPTHPVIWLTGQSGAGKSTIAKALAPKLNAVILDGDEMRESISLGAGFSQVDREEHNLRVARLALVLSKQSPVVVSVIAPFRETRKKIDNLISPIWVYIKRKTPKDPDRPYEIPHKPAVIVNSDVENTDEQVARIMNYLQQ